MTLSKWIAVGSLSALLIGSGVLHLVRPEVYLPMMPPYLPAHLPLVYLSGVFEILGGVGMLLPWTRRWAGLGVIALLIAVFPANIHIAINDIPVAGHDVPLWGHLLRLPLQAVMIWMAWWGTRGRTTGVTE
jgi:uncharacterized membrane protein